MATSTEEILLRLGMSAEGIKTGMVQANASVKSGLDSMKTMFVQAFSGVAILGAMNKVLDKFDEIQDRADNLGVGTDFLQGMQQVAKRDAVGGQETFNRAIAELSVRLGEAKGGTESAIKAFEKFGITLSDISRLDVEGMFYLIADKIKAIPDPTERAAAAFELLGKSGKNLTGILTGGAAQLKNMVEQADKLAAEDVKRLADAKDQIEDYTNTLTIWGGKLLGYVSTAAEYYGENLYDLQAQEAANTEKNLQAIEKVKKAEQDAANAKFAALDASFQMQMKAQKEAEKSAKLIKDKAALEKEKEKEKEDKKTASDLKKETKQKTDNLKQRKPQGGNGQTNYMPTTDQIRKSRKFGGIQREIDFLTGQATNALLEGNQGLAEQAKAQIEGYDVPLTPWQEAQNKAQEDLNKKMGFHHDIPFKRHVEGLKETLANAGLTPQDMSISNIDRNISDLLKKASVDGIKLSDK
jgi:hypothetical protein